MPRLIFSLFFTVFTGVLSLAVLTGWEIWEGAGTSSQFVYLMPVIGLWFIWDSKRRIKRQKSLRIEVIDGRNTYSWTEFDGSEQRSATDPRPQWQDEVEPV